MFTDREEPVTVFKKHLDSVLTGDTERIALVFYGVGGVGKTRLITELMTITENQTVRNDLRGKNVDVVALHASMDIHEYDSPLAVMIGLRRQIRSPCILFDYGLAKYLSSIGRSTNQIKEFIPKDSLWWDVLGEVMSFFHLPIGLVDRAIVKLRERYSDQFKLYYDEIEEIENIKHNPSEISIRLPRLLGLDLSVITGKGPKKFIVFLDSYESIFKRSGFTEGNTEADDFIKEFVISSSGVLFTVGSREHLKWSDMDPSWESILDQHILEYLSPDDSDYFLRSVPIDSKEIRESIIRTSKGLPLYLDLCVEIFKRKQDADLNPQDFLIPSKEIIARFLNHLPDNEMEMVRILSYVHFFDFALLETLARTMNVHFPTSKFQELTEHSFIKKMEDLRGMYKIHDNFYEYAMSNIENSRFLIGRILENSLNYLCNSNKRLDFQSLGLLYSNIIRLITNADEINLHTTESMIEISIYLLDNGYWNIVGNTVMSLQPAPGIDEQMNFLKSTYLRRVGRLTESNEILSSLESDRTRFGIYTDYVSYYRADVVRVLGRYDEAERIFRDILTRSSPEKDKSLYVRVQRQLGDLTLLKSRFKDALSILAEASRLSEPDSVEYAETLRIEGHIYRFNFLLEDASARYLNALRIAIKTNSIGLQGKLYNNLAETFCWISPERAIDYGERSLHINRELKSPVEIGKTLAALSISYVLQGNVEKAIQSATDSRKLQEEIGYEGGVLFANVAFAIISMAKKR